MHTRAQMRVRPTIEMFYRFEYLRFFRGAPGGIVTPIFSMVSFSNVRVQIGRELV